MASAARQGRRNTSWKDIAYSDSEHADEKTSTNLPLADDSYNGGPVSSLENSQASLNKRLASVAGLDDSAPKDFNFLFDPAHAKRRHICTTGASDLDLAKGVDSALPTAPVEEPKGSKSSTTDGTEQAPAIIEDAEFRWIRTEIRRGADLVDGQAWISEYQRRLKSASEASPVDPTGKTSAENPTRARRSNVSLGSDMSMRNRILREMGSSVPPPGKKVRLSTGDEVIFWFNVGPPGPPRARVMVTESRCPHQGVCLLKGELMEIEDATGVRHALSRCPRHNKQFDLRTGESQGNAEHLKVFPCRYEHGHWYVGMETSDHTSVAVEKAPTTPCIASTVAPLLEPRSAEKVYDSIEPHSRKKRRAGEEHQSLES
eukprot:TRINITY_DN45716_c0_g1_i1.p1 TRINITY_DN45716_c0_g1~~TRINITY_DN45716_c0_g1_i1.p1  ORF type:complete len:373 (+),score=27.09 TRINITY_DN45716_c0_g1_i1:80-1198(+)